ncbi:UDP-N-acetylmuramate--L-alanine ligase [Brachybacterium squillarum]|uniref:UDP-N-acetylmuramate--L-alanine ligase n=1 Tax=Brachybacterium squillarum TaxID=661979 RepID=UPI0002629B3F|nr:UDP-N-acetylmuramate--L-alanine ligase [Brachybacterium squillarum]
MSSDAASPGPIAPRTILAPGPVVSRADWPAEQEPRALHVIRIGGAGMSAVARLALEAGLAVSGSDSQDGQFIGPLREAGATIGIGFDAAQLPADCDLVVVSTAVRADNPELLAARERGIPVIHRAAALAGLLGERPLIAVAGTHGKTSTTGMAVTALRGAGTDPAWALGAAVPDLGRNAGFGAASAPGTRLPADADRQPAVVEADESDGSFLAFAPRALVVTNLEADHLDFHGDEATLIAGFDALADRVVPGGTLVVCADDPGARALGERARARGIAVQEYGTAADADWELRAEDAAAGGTVAELRTPSGPLTLRLAVAGHHNVLNALGALAACAAALPAADPALLAAGMASFTGASRRFDVAGTVGGVTVVDDYAHHPREVAATLEAARGIVAQQPGPGRVLAVFQPHLYSRTRAFGAEFAAALAAADLAWVMPVYGAREDPDPSVDARTITAHQPTLTPLDEAGAVIPSVRAAARPGDLLLMLGAGDVVETTPQLLATLDAPVTDAGEPEA